MSFVTESRPLNPVPFKLNRNRCEKYSVKEIKNGQQLIQVYKVSQKHVSNGEIKKTIDCLPFTSF